ncbi:hypothetical protein ACO0LB_14595 [Undibacterium sp. SXout7W]|uniref:hypothetical protein n=1 Tax=Undibacterium sp. SXout7W TaxID=3413049 RepID=UPI003BF014D2
MIKRAQRVTQSDDLILAIGLIWGHLNTAQYERADRLARGCLCIWPDDERIIVMAAFASVEMGNALNEKMLEVLYSAQCREWADMVLRRAGKTKEMLC